MANLAAVRADVGRRPPLSRFADITEIMTAPRPPISPDDTSTRKPDDITTHKTELNVSRIAAAALAAVTTAVVGSKLGAEGTLIGAAAASVVTTVATAAYQSSLERSQQRVRSLAHRTRPTQTSQSPDRSRQSASLRWGAVVLGALGGFMLAMMAITGFEWASGGAVGGNGQGTTIGQVVGDQSGPQQPTVPPATPHPVVPMSETPTESAEPPVTSTTAPNDQGGREQTPTTTANRPTPNPPTPSGATPPPLIPGLPGVGG